MSRVVVYCFTTMSLCHRLSQHHVIVWRPHIHITTCHHVTVMSQLASHHVTVSYSIMSPLIWHHHMCHHVTVCCVTIDESSCHCVPAWCITTECHHVL